MSIDLFADENEPEVRQTHIVYQVTLPLKQRMNIQSKDSPWIYVEVDNYGVISIGEATHWTTAEESIHVDSVRREIIAYLVEWELVTWRRVSDEDYELFATKRLTGEK